MKAHILQHVPFEDIGSMAGWLARRHIKPSHTRFYLNQDLPAVHDVDLLIIMGGPMSVHDDFLFPWLLAEIKFVRQAIERGTSILGVCLGAQLLAHALDGHVYRNPVPEIGWFPVEAVAHPDSTFLFPASCTVFHWHGETFTLPHGAIHLAQSQACKNQAFQLNHNVIGLQFHLETTQSSLQAMVAHGRQELTSGPYVQSEAHILAARNADMIANNALADRVLSYITHTPELKK
jgi:GMP synthase-like glutamine amidotransferase